MSKSDNLRKAKVTKNDEFYTQLHEIENELKYYSHYLEDKIIYCNCDNPRYSNFWNYLYDNFHILGLKCLISTYLDNEQSYKTTYDGKTVKQEKLVGNGDFRSDECIEILKECDVVITNPPFSLIRAFFDLLIENNKQFLFIGTIGSVGYINVFKEFKKNRCWTGKTHPTNYVKPDGSNCHMGNTIWITNIGENVKELVLTKKYEDGSYIKYCNFDAINVDKVSDIPYDYYGIMGVPITFIEKYNPNQFKIIGIDRLPYSIELGIREIGQQWYNDFRSSGNKGHYTPNMRNLCLYENGQAKVKFSRILIQRKKGT